MLSLNSLPDNKSIAREMQSPRPKTPHTDALELRSDFQSVLMAAVQPAKAEPVAAAAKEITENKATPTPKPEPIVNAQQNQASTETRTEAVPAQKTGHETKDADSTDLAGTEKQEAPSKAPEGAAKSAARPQNELLQALGLATTTARMSTAIASREAQKPNADKKSASPLATTQNQTARTQTATSTLNLLQKAPDAVLSQADGLKRLSEKLGTGFLAKFAEKLNEKPGRQHSTETGRIEAGRNNSNQTSVQQPNKAGHGSARSDNEADARSGQRGTRNASARGVSRETPIAENPAPLQQPQAENTTLVNPTNHDTTMRSQQTSTQDIRLSDVANNLREVQNARASVETPLARPDLVRQFNEIMTRAQVLVTDTQNARFSVKLFPREIGRMEIDLKLVDGEMKGKIIVENEDVKNEMQNFLQNKENHSDGEAVDLNKIDIEVRSESQNTQNSERTPEDTELLQNLVTRTASVLYEAVDVPAQKGNALYA